VGGNKGTGNKGVIRGQTGRTPVSRSYATKAKPSWRESAGGFLGRPPLRGAQVRGTTIKCT
jgi:hypothetical protein